MIRCPRSAERPRARRPRPVCTEPTPTCRQPHGGAPVRTPGIGVPRSQLNGVRPCAVVAARVTARRRALALPAVSIERDQTMSKPFKGVVNVDIRDSEPDWAPFEAPRAPDGAPNVVYVVLD